MVHWDEKNDSSVIKLKQTGVNKNFPYFFIDKYSYPMREYGNSFFTLPCFTSKYYRKMALKLSN